MAVGGLEMGERFTEVHCWAGKVIVLGGGRVKDLEDVGLGDVSLWGPGGMDFGRLGGTGGGRTVGDLLDGRGVKG